MTAKAKRIRWVAEVLTLTGTVVAILIGVYNVQADRHDDQNARASEARAARQAVIEDVLRMGQYDAQGGRRNQFEILVLAADAEQLIDEFGQDRLHLSPRVYRLLAEFVSYSTNDLELAERLAERVLDVASPESREVVFAHRVLGDVAAQRLDAPGVEEHFDVAITLNREYRERVDYVGSQDEEFTRAYRLLSALLGASLSRSRPPVHEEFCGLAQTWQPDVALVTKYQGNDRVFGLLRRIKVKSVDQLSGVCGQVADEPTPAAP